MAISLVHYSRVDSNCFDDLKISLFDLTHSGQESYWFAVSNGKDLKHAKGNGIIDLTSSYDLSGFAGIGSNSPKPHAEPAISYSRKLKNFALALEGYIINGNDLREKYGGRTDPELCARFIADAGDFVNGVKNLVNEAKGYYNIFVLTEKGETYGFRCPLGIRPIIFGKGDKGYAAVSESRALFHIDMELEKDVEAGEIFGIDGSGIHTIEKLENKKHVCSFLWPYYQMPDSITEGISIYCIKKRIGEVLGKIDKETGLEIDLVTYVPDSGKFFEEGYAEVFGCEHRRILTKYQYAGRSYERPEQKYRDLIAGVKLTVIPYEAKNKRIVLFDDSIRRGTQIIREGGPIDLLKRSGVEEIHLRLGSPRNIKYCRFAQPDGDRYKDEELAANRFKTDEDMAKYLGIKSVRFIGIDDFVKCIIEGSKLRRENLCLGCYTGDFGFID